MAIRYLKNIEIDRTAWDACISRATNGRVYAYSWYLDLSTSNWDALVLDDYQAVFPLPWNAKLIGLKQVYHPYFSQQLGLFFNETVAKERPENLVGEFLKSLPNKFRFLSLALNEANSVDDKKWKNHDRTNYLLDLNQSIENLRAGYSKSLRKRIRRAGENLTFIPNANGLENFVERYHQNLKSTFELPQTAYPKAQQLLNEIQQRGFGQLYRVIDIEGNILGEIFLPKSNGRLYYLMGYATTAGKAKHATHFLLDQIFEYYANQEIVFDFEGSSIPSIADFFAAFGSKKVHYPVVEIDRLPKIVRWLKNRK